MKNQYYADVNDYRKYGLLRCLARDPGLLIGVCWMLTPDDGRTDGRFISYSSDPKRWRRYDPPLFDSLSAALASGRKREVNLASKAGHIPGALFFERLLEDDRAGREAFFSEMFRVLALASLIFFDPDNGLEIRSKHPGTKGSCKYLYWTELEEAYSRGHSVLVYQHFPREDRSGFTRRVVGRVRERLSGAEIYALRTSNVVYFLAAHAKHVPSIRAGLRTISEKWPGQIEFVPGLAANNSLEPAQ